MHKCINAVMLSIKVACSAFSVLVDCWCQDGTIGTVISGSDIWMMMMIHKLIRWHLTPALIASKVWKWWVLKNVAQLLTLCSVDEISPHVDMCLIVWRKGENVEVDAWLAWGEPRSIKWHLIDFLCQSLNSNWSFSSKQGSLMLRPKLLLLAKTSGAEVWLAAALLACA